MAQKHVRGNGQLFRWRTFLNKLRTGDYDGQSMMRLEIKGLAELRERLARIQAEEVMARALAEQAAKLAQSVRDGLSETPGLAEHDRPWLQTGALRESLGSQTDRLQAVVGSSDPAAAPQEMGTSKMEARPFLAPIAAGMGEEIASAIGAEVAAALNSLNSIRVAQAREREGTDPQETVNVSATAGVAYWNAATLNQPANSTSLASHLATSLVPVDQTIASSLPEIGQAISGRGITNDDSDVVLVGDVIFGHGDRHVADPEGARLEILGNLPDRSHVVGPFWGLTPNYIYRAYPLPNGDLSIGTYYDR